MGAPKGNEYYKLAQQNGRPKKYTPELLLKKAFEYFQYVEDHPLYERKAFAYTGSVTTEDLPKMRAYTITGFCLFAGITFETFSQYKKQKEFSEVINTIEKICFDQKFTGAAADLLNSNIISRDLGLAERIDQTVSRKSKIEVIDEETRQAIEEMRKRFNDEAENEINQE